MFFLTVAIRIICDYGGTIDYDQFIIYYCCFNTKALGGGGRPRPSIRPKFVNTVLLTDYGPRRGSWFYYPPMYSYQTQIIILLCISDRFENKTDLLTGHPLDTYYSSHSPSRDCVYTVCLYTNGIYGGRVYTFLLRPGHIAPQYAQQPKLPGRRPGG